MLLLPLLVFPAVPKAPPSLKNYDMLLLLGKLFIELSLPALGARFTLMCP
jgi:hypothetical protein